MKYLAAVLFAGLPASLYSQNAAPRDWSTVGGLCGRVTDSQYTSTPRGTSYLLGAGHPTEADVLLYRFNAHKKCCSKNESPILKVKTENDGSFEFKDVPPGQYWVVVTVGKRKYKVAVTLNPLADKTLGCSERVFRIKEEELQILRMITLH